MTQEVAICTAANETYALGAAAALVSTVLHAPEGAHCRVYVLDGGIRERSWRKLQASLRRLGRPCELVRLRPDMQTFAGLPQDWGSSVMTYARLALPQMVREDRLLYVDADMIVQAPWEDLWAMDLAGAVVAAARDIITKNIGSEHFDLEKFQLDPQAPYFQAGFLVMDLRLWREACVSSCVLAYLRENPAHCRYWDQSALNVILYRRWKRLPDEWNTPAWWADQQKEGCRLDAPVLHFVGPNKPWFYAPHMNPSTRRFFACLDQTAWKDWRPSALRFACKMAKYRVGQGLGALLRLLKNKR
jgi:lipopolysaccharide biosynthesis glycosyltransferase